MTEETVRSMLKSPRWQIALALLVLAIIGLDLVAASLAPSGPAYVVEPVLEPSLHDLRMNLQEGGHGGERIELSITEREAEKSITWYLDRHPEIPFRYPRITFRPNYIEAWGEVETLGLRLSIYGQMTLVLENGVPTATLTQLKHTSIPRPDFILETIRDTVYEQVDRELPIIFETLELREGEIVVRGTIRQ